MEFYTPILLVVSKNSEKAGRIFEILRSIKPPQLYLYGGAGFAAEVSALAQKIDWKCQVKTLTTKENVPALEWFFSSIADEGIVVKDECVPDTSFFYFCDAMAERYRAKRTVLTVCGVSSAAASNIKHSYAFTHLAAGSAWGSWKRAWQSNQVELTTLFETNSITWNNPESMSVTPKSNLIDHADDVPVIPLTFPLEHQITFPIL